MSVKRTERGWPGHFIGGQSCVYHRNTLLELGDQRVIVSTVGNYRPYRQGEWPMETIGAFGRYYETMAFMAERREHYWEVDVTREVSFESDWAISADSPDALPDGVDTVADQMHEAVVTELTLGMKAGNIEVRRY